MIPVPKYLNKIAEVLKQKDNTLTLNIRCTCGCQKFIVLKNLTKKANLSKEDKKRIKESLEWYDNILDPLITNSYKAAYLNYNEEDVREIIIYNSKENLSANFDKEKYKSIIVKTFRIKKGEIPLDWSEINALHPIDETVIIKIICDNCGKDYIIFDNRIHGNDAADFKCTSFSEYDFKQKFIKGTEDNLAVITITIKNYWDFNNLHECDDSKLISDDYSNMFGYIRIQATAFNGINTLIYSGELG